jgi:hypothetical protein
MNSFMEKWWNRHPVPKRGRRNRKWVDFIFAHPLFLMASLSMMHRWDVLFNYRSPSQAHKQMWDVYQIMVLKKTRCVLLTRTSMCALLVCKLIGFRGIFQGMFQPNQLKYLAKCVVTPFHFIGKTKNEAESLFQEGKKMLKQSSYRATEMFEKASLLMHPESNAVLSNMMFECHHKLSFKYAALGERMGCLHSKGLLAQCYIHGKGVIKDYAKGLALANESAKTGSFYGQFALAICYRNGICVTQDNAETVRLLHLSAAQGYAIAQFGLGTMYDRGVGVAQDDAEAVRLYSLAAEQNYFHAKYQLDCMHRDGRGGA